MKASFAYFCLFGCLLFSSSFIVRVESSEEDTIEGEDDYVQVEDEPVDESKRNTDVEKDLDAEEDVKAIEPSPDAEITFLFTEPTGTKDLPSGKLAKYLIGFYNKGEKDFIVKYAETSFRYPMDFSYYIQNYTLAKYEYLVQPKQEATFDYGFFPSENYAGRPLGLVVNLRYEDSEGIVYENSVFNETVTIVEDESGFNPETGFIYLVFACLLILLLLLGQQFLSKMRRKHGMTKKPTSSMEIGTANKHEVDFEWIPTQVLNMKTGSPGRSPRNRKIRHGDD